MIEALSWLGFVMGVVSLYACVKHRWGWLLGALSSIPIAIYTIVEHEWAWLATTSVYGIVDLYNWRVVRK